MSPNTPGGKTILCVDDTPYVLQMLEMFLGAVGYRALLASNAGQAISLALSKNPNAAILDYEMPNVNGLELAQILKQSHPSMPILMYSARLPQVEISAAGVIDSYVEKENPQALVLELARLLGDPTPILVRRRFPRFAVSSPLVLRFQEEDSTGERAVQGMMNDLAEGGCGGIVDAQIVPGDLVSLAFEVPRCDVTLELRARVRYHHADSHGFEFVDVTATQHQWLRRCLEALATN